MEHFIALFKKDITKRIIVFAILILAVYLLKDLVNLLLLTFLLTFLINSFENFLLHYIQKLIPFKKIILTIILYIAIAGTIGFVLYMYLPAILNQTVQLAGEVRKFSMENHNNILMDYTATVLKDLDVMGIVKQQSGTIVNYAKMLGDVTITIFLSLLLSLFFILEEKRITKFFHKFEYSKISIVYRELHYFGKKFLDTFGKVFQAQIVIALVNSVLSIIGLSIMSFPYVLGLGFMIFILGLIPFGGVIVSLVPLSLIAYSTGGIVKVASVLVLVAILHTVEAYILNPKLYSARTELPVFLTFLVLFVSEHFFGPWGLVVGLPLFVFILDLADVDPHDEGRKELLSVLFTRKKTVAGTVEAGSTADGAADGTSDSKADVTADDAPGKKEV